MKEEAEKNLRARGSEHVEGNNICTHQLTAPVNACTRLVQAHTRQNPAVEIYTPNSLWLTWRMASCTIYAHVKYMSGLFSGCGIQLLFSAPAEDYDLWMNLPLNKLPSIILNSEIVWNFF